MNALDSWTVLTDGRLRKDKRKKVKAQGVRKRHCAVIAVKSRDGLGRLMAGNTLYCHTFLHVHPTFLKGLGLLYHRFGDCQQG
ncbi:MAG: hypothetical protein IJJ80_11720 [Clostridia bacterium]|nr:hypothetical protein [Clostridia bacterium]MBQ6234163.1 hypothetical protein [Clostridia bacterium]